MDLRIPKDPEKRRVLFRMAGLTEDEERAVNEWCARRATEDADRLRAGMERLDDLPMADPEDGGSDG